MGYWGRFIIHISIILTIIFMTIWFKMDKASTFIINYIWGVCYNYSMKILYNFKLTQEASDQIICLLWQDMNLLPLDINLPNLIGLRSTHFCTAIQKSAALKMKNCKWLFYSPFNCIWRFSAPESLLDNWINALPKHTFEQTFIMGSTWPFSIIACGPN